MSSAAERGKVDERTARTHAAERENGSRWRLVGQLTHRSVPPPATRRAFHQLKEKKMKKNMYRERKKGNNRTTFPFALLLPGRARFLPRASSPSSSYTLNSVRPTSPSYSFLLLFFHYSRRFHFPFQTNERTREQNKKRSYPPSSLCCG